MRRRAAPIRALLLAAVVIPAAGGCTRAVLLDDPKPLTYRERAAVPLGYHVPSDTLNRTYSTRAWAMGLGSRYVLSPGQILDQYSRAYLAGAFLVFQPAVSPAPGTDDPDFVVTMEIPYFELSGTRAHVGVRATVRNRAGAVVQREERTRVARAGRPAAGTAGGDSERATIRRSIDQAIRPALAEIVRELRAQSADWPRGPRPPPPSIPPPPPPEPGDAPVPAPPGGG